MVSFVQMYKSRKEDVPQVYNSRRGNVLEMYNNRKGKQPTNVQTEKTPAMQQKSKKRASFYF